MNSTDIQHALYDHHVGTWLPKRALVIPNVTIYQNAWERDFVYVSEAGYMTEFEIKISRSDYRRDFDSKPNKHRMLSGQYPRKHITKHFYFACPAALIKLHEVPEYAGLVWIQEDGTINTRRRAPKLNARKLTARELYVLCQDGMRKFYREWKLNREAKA